MSKHQKATADYDTKVKENRQSVIVLASLIGLGGILLHSAITSIFSKLHGIMAGKACLGIICNFI